MKKDREFIRIARMHELQYVCIMEEESFLSDT